MLRRALPGCLLALLLAAPQLGAAEVRFTITEEKTGHAVADAVVSLVALDAPTPAPAPATIEIAQVNKTFVPDVTPVGVGSTVMFTNRETKGDHHVYSLSAAKKFEIPLHKPGTATAVVFDKPGVAVLGCNIHDWMRAHVVVLATPWFAKTDARGSATLAAPPPGRYRAEVWHARLGRPVTRELTLPAESAAAIGLTLAPDTRIKRGPAAAGGGYR